MLLVGLTGGVASGKSLVSQVWKGEGAHVIDADQIARELVGPSKPAWREIVKAFGRQILREDGSVDRKQLARRVFSNPADRDRLNRILHPRIKREIERRIAKLRRKGGKGSIVVVEAALLVETGYDKEVDKVVVVTSSKRKQMERLKMREQVDEGFARAIIDSQIDGRARAKVADILIRNEGSRKKTEERAKEVFQELKRVALQQEG